MDITERHLFLKSRSSGKIRNRIESNIFSSFLSLEILYRDMHAGSEPIRKQIQKVKKIKHGL